MESKKQREIKDGESDGASERVCAHLCARLNPS